MSLSKIPFLLAGLVTAHTLQTPPKALLPANREKTVGWLEWYITNAARFNCKVVKALTSIPLLIEGAIILAGFFPSNEASRWILQVLAGDDTDIFRRLVLSPSFFAISAIGVAGGALRYQCYRTLGRFFTFELAIHRGHQLVTEGPYRYVRHPSYTAWVVGTLGVSLMPLTRGSWFYECDFVKTQRGKAALAFGVAWWLFGVVGLTRRIPTEEMMMKREFGEEWEAYTKRVPYRLVPYVF